MVGVLGHHPGKGTTQFAVVFFFPPPEPRQEAGKGKSDKKTSLSLLSRPQVLEREGATLPARPISLADKAPPGAAAARAARPQQPRGPESGRRPRPADHGLSAWQHPRVPACQAALSRAGSQVSSGRRRPREPKAARGRAGACALPCVSGLFSSQRPEGFSTDSPLRPLLPQPCPREVSGDRWARSADSAQGPVLGGPGRAGAGEKLAAGRTASAPTWPETLAADPCIQGGREGVEGRKPSPLTLNPGYG